MLEGVASLKQRIIFFIVCDLFGKVWFLVCQWLGISFVFPGAIKDHYFQFIHVAGMPRVVHSYLKIIWRACIWAIWKNRNNCIFKNEIINPIGILEDELLFMVVFPLSTYCLWFS